MKSESLRLADTLSYHKFYVPGRFALDLEQAAAELRRLHAVNIELLAALQELESAVDWQLGRSAFTQTTHLKGLAHSNLVRQKLFAAQDAARAAIAKATGDKE